MEQETTVPVVQKELSPYMGEDMLPPTINGQEEAIYVCPDPFIPMHSEGHYQKRDLGDKNLLYEKHVAGGDLHLDSSSLQRLHSIFDSNQYLEPISVHPWINTSIGTEMNAGQLETISWLSRQSCRIKTSLLTENNKDQLDKYICPKCDCILHDAVQTSCGHWLCNECAEELFDKNEGTIFCPRPDCDEELTNEDERPFFPDRFVRKQISRFSIMCPNRKLGCDWNDVISKVFVHLESCVFEKQECPHCSKPFSPSEYQSHVDRCPKMTVTCPLKDHGCKETKEMTREECIEHLSSKNVFFDHLSMMAAALSSLSTGPLKSESLESYANLVQSDGGGGGSDSKYRSALPTAPRRYVSTDGPDPRGSDLGFLEDSVAGAVGGGRYGDMGGGRVDDKLMSLVMTKITGMQAELTKKDSQIHTLQDKVAQLETTLSTKMSENEDRDFRLSLMENSNFDGSMVWKIPQFSQRMDDARTGRYTSIFSLPFYSSRYGYKMCLRLYILGDGIGKGTHMSLFFVVMKGEFDNILQWPFTHKVTFKLINQCGGRHIMDVSKPDPLNSSFQKPKSDMNVARGCPRFVSMNELMQGGFIEDDAIFIKVKVDTTTMLRL